MGIIMATIPLGNFGQLLPQAPQGRVLDTGSQVIGQAVNQLGEVGQKVALKDLHEQQKIQEEKDEYFFNTQAAKYGAEYTDVVTDTKNKLITGEFDETTAKTNLRRRTDELNETYRQTLPDTKHIKFDYYTERMFLESEANIRPIAYETEKRKINADFDEVNEATLKIENREQAYGLFKSTLERNPVLTPEQRVSLDQEWKQRRDLSDAKGAFSALVNASDVQGLTKYENSLDKLFPNMKLETRDTLKGQISNAKDSINKAKELEQRKFLTELKGEVSSFTTDAYTGYPLDAEVTNSLLAKVKGTEYEPEVVEAIALNKSAQDFRKKSPIDQEKEYNRLKSQLENTPQKDASRLEKQLAMFKGIVDASKQRAEKDPVSQLQSQDRKVLYTAPVDKIGTQQIDYKQANITTQALIDKKNKNGGVGSLIQLNDTERKALVAKYNDATPQQQVSMLLDLSRISNANPNVKLEYYSLLVGKDNAHMLLGVNAYTALGANVPNTNVRIDESVLTGMNIINMNQEHVLADKKAFQQAIAPLFGNKSPLGTMERKTYEDLAYSIYLSESKRLGVRTDDKGKPIIDRNRVQSAFTMTTGGTYQQKLGNNINTIYRPYGMSKSTFEDKLDEKVTRSYFKDTGVRIERGFLSTHALDPIPNKQNWYRFKNPDGSIHINQKTKQPYMVEIK